MTNYWKYSILNQIKQIMNTMMKPNKVRTFTYKALNRQATRQINERMRKMNLELDRKQK